MNSASLRTIETSISESNVQSKIGELLYALGYVHHDEEIVNLELGKGKGIVPLKFTIRKEGGT